MLWAPWAGAGHSFTSQGAQADLAFCALAPVAVWGCTQLPHRGAGDELSPARAMARADPTVPLWPWAGSGGVCRGERALWQGRRRRGAGCGLAAGLGWEGKRPRAGSDAACARRKCEHRCPPRPDVPHAASSWATCVRDTDMVGPAPFCGDESGSAQQRWVGEGRAVGRCCQEPVPLPETCGTETLLQAARLCQEHRALPLQRQMLAQGGGRLGGTGHALDFGAPQE